MASFEWAFCVHAVKSKQPFVVEDATKHPLVRENPLVTQDGIRCYLGLGSEAPIGGDLADARHGGS